MAVSTLVRLSEDKVTRQAYQNRQDEIMLQNKKAADYERMEREACARNSRRRIVEN
jgi:hypothetical protein